MPDAASHARKTLTALTGSALALAGLTFVAPPAQAADPVTINLVGINDFHGRIDSNTVAFAKTVQDVKGLGTPANTLFVGAGDLVGASVFASATAEDQPTIDVLNELGLEASSVGNHEFDKGWADLRDRIIGPDADPNAAWEYLGANVYKKGTQTPALPSYWVKDVGGIKVGVVGAVTQETSTLVSPGGITDLDFGPVVPALNRVADELTDGQAGNGEADVLVAVVHAGAIDGTKGYDQEVAQKGEFQDMALHLSPKFDAAFQGHTHQTYAYAAPVEGGDLPTRPMLQTGNYGSNVGNIQLSVDPDTKKVVAYTQNNVARVTSVTAEQIAADPALTAVKKTVDDAVAAAAVVGNQPVGSITADITTALPDPTKPPALSGANNNRDDRTNESTLGDLVGNAMRDGVPADMGDPDIGIVNSGGLRAELLYKGDTTTGGPLDADGVVTYAEANNVLPFVNNVWLGRLTGAALKNVLEEQWQPSGASRPKMPLGLSDNVVVTYDESQPRYSKVTSVMINGQPLDPAKTYTVSTFNFLATGGDNFSSFKQGAWTDTGLVDRDLWIGYLKTHPHLSPDFARQQIGVAGLPATVRAGDAEWLDVTKLDLTSAGSPANTSISVTATSPSGHTSTVTTAPVTGGAARLRFTVPESLARGGLLTVTAQPTGTTFTIPVTARTPAPASVRVVGPKKVRQGTRPTYVVFVAGSADRRPTGSVTLRVGRRYVTVALRDQTAVVRLPRLKSKGHKKVVAVYSGDGFYATSTTTKRIVVQRRAR